MNKIIQEYLPQILTDIKAWDKKTLQPRVKWINEQLQNVRENLWYDRIFFRALRRFMRLAILLGAIHPDDCELIDLGYNTEILWLYPKDQEIQETISNYLEFLLQDKWYNSEEWGYSEVTVDEIVALQICPEELQDALFPQPKWQQVGLL